MTNKEIPLLFGSPKDKALFTAKEFIKKIKYYPPNEKTIVFFFGNTIYEELVKKFGKKLKPADSNKPAYFRVKIGKKKIIFIKSEIGAQSAITRLEEAVALKTKEIYFIGSIGALQEKKIGDIIIPTRAIRDEGTSYHYLKAGKYAYPNTTLTKKVRKECEKEKIEFECGTTWTIDAPYRETIRKFEKYKKEGVIGVEMEAAALFAASKALKVKVAGICWISDVLHEKGWNPKFYTKEYFIGANKAFNVLLKVLEK